VDQLLPPRRNRPSLHAAGEMAAEALGFMARGANGGRAAELVTRDFLGGCAGSDDARDASARNDAVVSPSAPVLCVLEFGKPLSLSLSLSASASVLYFSSPPPSPACAVPSGFGSALLAPLNCQITSSHRCLIELKERTLTLVFLRFFGGKKNPRFPQRGDWRRLVRGLQESSKWFAGTMILKVICSSSPNSIPL
jgi:hypothetical protein